ncbi:origin recognition complex subunit 5 [Acrasis kona]|uniref:Origin recognition complex subunit 5 n=1 Tax=Acrasis kona TaxID=1008807 RepID=A0AAW2YWW9_9EUKA
MVQRATDSGLVYTIQKWFWAVFNFIALFFSSLNPASESYKNVDRIKGTTFVGRTSGTSGGSGGPKPPGRPMGRRLELEDNFPTSLDRHFIKTCRL